MTPARAQSPLRQAHAIDRRCAWQSSARTAPRNGRDRSLRFRNFEPAAMIFARQRARNTRLRLLRDVGCAPDYRLFR
jgi:hypothetical protein